MKIGVIIPDKNDRPKFLENCLRMINSQTVKPDIIELINDKPIDINPDGYVLPEISKCDITLRYKTGYDRLRNKGIQMIFLMENDDWYAPDYIETMLKYWEEKGRPDIFGLNYTIYYHIKLFAYFTMNHTTRSSAMSTMLRADLDFPWCRDDEPYTDLHLWKVIKGCTFTPGRHICLGIKHGEGDCGGKMHTDRLYRYEQNGAKDVDKSFLKTVLDQKSYEFYSKYYETL